MKQSLPDSISKHSINQSLSLSLPKSKQNNVKSQILPWLKPRKGKTSILSPHRDSSSRFMGLFSNLRGPRIGAAHDELPLANGSSSSSSSSHSSSIRRKLSNLLPICVALVVIAEIGFLGRLDKVALVDTLTDFFTQSPSLSQPPPPSRSERKIDVVGTEKICEEWLTREDSVTYSRDFGKNPIFISGGAKVISIGRLID